VTESNHNQLDGPESATTHPQTDTPQTRPPQTGHPAVDDALVELSDLASTPLAEHHDRLGKVHEVLRETLDRGDDDGPSD
jgi:hypothetical protein